SQGDLKRSKYWKAFLGILAGVILYHFLGSYSCLSMSSQLMWGGKPISVVVLLFYYVGVMYPRTAHQSGMNAMKFCSDHSLILVFLVVSSAYCEALPSVAA